MGRKIDTMEVKIEGAQGKGFRSAPRAAAIKVKHHGVGMEITIDAFAGTSDTFGPRKDPLFAAKFDGEEHTVTFTELKALLKGRS